MVELIPWIDEEVRGIEVVRHGTLDGGVEAHVKCEDGSVWGWQAKYFHEVDNSQLQQMKGSLTSALKNYETLSRYTFVLPIDPSSSAPQGRKTGRQKVDDAFARWESEAAETGRTLKISLVGESRLLDILTAEEQAGRVRYWFDSRLLFSKDWQRKSVKAAVDAAGPRYTPEVNVDLPLSFAFEGLGRTAAFQDRLTEHVAEVARATRYFHPSQESGLTDDLAVEVGDVAATVKNLVSMLEATPIAGPAPLDWNEHVSGLRDAWQRLDTLHMKLFNREEVLRSEESGGGTTSRDGPWEAIQSLRLKTLDVSHSLDDLIDFVSSPAARLAATPLLFLSGDAGTGKTHLLCDVAERRVKAGRPTVLVMGEQIGEGNPRTLVPDQLGLEGMGMEEFLSALNAAGEVAGTRALLMVDAINEGGGLAAWPAHLRSLCAEVASYPHLGLVLSCRSSYVEAMLDAEPGLYEARLRNIGFVGVRHAGFAGSEWRAARRFFEHYGLPLPDFPLLIPEYTNPLFLKLLCQSLQEAGETTLPRGASGITAVFERFLSQVNRSLARPDRCDFPRETALVSQIVAKVAAALLSTNSEHISLSDYRDICEGTLGSQGWEKSLAKGLLNEGVFALDRFGREQVVRLSYQRLDDHLQAAQLLRTQDAEGVRAFLADLEKGPSGFYQRSSLLEALAVQLPEKLGCELHELVTDPADDVIQAAFLESIVWRDPRSFPEDLALDYLNSIITREYNWYGDRVLDTLLQVACVPDHPFNAELLDKSLARTQLARRDAWWTTYINSCSRDDSVVYRIIDWARSPEQQAVPDDASRLAAITLTWFLASSNRQLRDCATKALVSLLYRRVPVLVDLLTHFDSVDDPYIAERLYAATYGCALSTTDPEALKALASAVSERVFASGHPPVDIMLRDYARGVVEVAVERRVGLSGVNLDLVRPPYKSSWPVRIPSEETLKRLAPRSTHGGLWSSLGAIGDFAQYTVRHAVGYFEAPNQRQRRRQRREERRRAQEKKPAPSVPDEPWAAELRAMLNRVGQQPSQEQSEQPVMWTGEEAARWIFRRVLRLGWTPDLLGDYDTSVRSRGRSANDDRTERIGKKYQWIAFHELLARIADHCRFQPRFNYESGPYESPSQLGLRDVDPSVTFRPLEEAGRGSAVTWWQPMAVDLERFVDDTLRIEWLTSERDILTDGDLRTLLQAHHSDGSKWLTLYGMYSWKEDPPLYTSVASSREALLWLQVRSYLIPRRDFQAFIRWAKKQDWCGRWMPEGPSTDDTYLGEWPRRRFAGSGSDGPRTIEGRHYRKGEAPTEVVPTWADYHWEGDGSLAGGVNKVIPTSWLVRGAGFRWHAGDFAFADSSGEVVVFDPSAKEQGPSALLVREDFLRAFLDREGYSLVWTALGEKDAYGEFDRLHPPFLGISGIGGLESGDGPLEAKVRTWLQTPGAEPTPTVAQE